MGEGSWALVGCEGEGAGLPGGLAGSPVGFQLARWWPVRSLCSLLAAPGPPWLQSVKLEEEARKAREAMAAAEARRAKAEAAMSKMQVGGGAWVGAGCSNCHFMACQDSCVVAGSCWATVLHNLHSSAETEGLPRVANWAVGP